VERTSAWLSRSCRLARDYERLLDTGEAMVHATMSRIMLRRVAGWVPRPHSAAILAHGF
jgi:hypothetical protein